MIIRNSALCLLCQEEIESKHRHDFVTCPCGNVSVDGGTDYLRRASISGLWEDTSIERIFDSVEELVLCLYNVHAKGTCWVPQRCTIHAPTEHHMREWKVDWRNSRIERLCPHGDWHPDPDGINLECWACDRCCFYVQESDEESSHGYWEKGDY